MERMRKREREREKEKERGRGRGRGNLQDLTNRHGSMLDSIVCSPHCRPLSLFANLHSLSWCVLLTVSLLVLLLPY